MTTRTTYRALDARAATHVATLNAEDPVVRANRLINDAVALQDDGRFDQAEELLGDAEALLSQA